MLRTNESFRRWATAIWMMMTAMTLGLGCGDNQQPAEARALWDEIHELDYRSFSRAPGYETSQPSSIHGDRVDIYINDTVVAALEAGEPLTEWPLGSLIVKDGLDGDGGLDLVAVMDKREDGWFFAEYTDLGSGDALYSGRPSLCVDCHSSGDDDVRAFDFP
jgi:hypothetical protein